MQSLFKISINNQYELLREAGVDTAEKCTFTQWRLQTEHKTYKLYPKSCILLASLVGCCLFWKRIDNRSLKKSKEYHIENENDKK